MHNLLPRSLPLAVKKFLTSSGDGLYGMWVSWNSVSHQITSGNHAPGRATGGTNLLFRKMLHARPYSHLVVTSVDTDCIYKFVLMTWTNDNAYVCDIKSCQMTFTVTSRKTKALTTPPSFLHNYHMKVSMHDGNLDGVMRIFVHLS